MSKRTSWLLFILLSFVLTIILGSITVHMALTETKLVAAVIAGIFIWTFLNYMMSFTKAVVSEPKEAKRIDPEVLEEMQDSKWKFSESDFGDDRDGE